MSGAGSDVHSSNGVSGADPQAETAELLYQLMYRDPRFGPLFANNASDLSSKLQSFLANAFERDWPHMLVRPSLLDRCFEDFASALDETVQSASGDHVLSDSVDALGRDLLDDERIVSFFKYIRYVAVHGEPGSDDEEYEAEDEEAQDVETPAPVEPSKVEVEVEVANGNRENAHGEDVGGNKDAAAASAGNLDINVNSFEELHLDQKYVDGAQNVWRLFISTAASREAAGEAIYSALFESAPSLQMLFTTPRAVQAMKFMNGLASFVLALDDPPKLKILVETLGFGHLHLDVTIPRVVIFRDAILDLFMIELAEKFNSQARDGWRRLLNYVGGALIFIKANYATRITCLLKDWKMCNKSEEDKAAAGAEGVSDSAEAQQGIVAEKGSKSKWKLFNKKGEGQTAKEGAQTIGTDTKAGTGTAQKTMIGSTGVPTTYPEMFMFNAAVMGYGNSSWMNEVLALFHNIVTNVSNSARLQEECDILALRIARVVKGQLNLSEYKSCMLASLRSLLPKEWDPSHEVAWTWLWENVERLVLKVHGQPPVWEKALTKVVSSLDEETRYEIRKDIYSRFFALAPAGQDFFKQSNTYLHIIADKIIAMTLDMYTDPVKMVDDISALGLRHVGYAIPTEFFSPFVTACVEVLMTKCSDDAAIEAFRYSLGLVSKILVRTITEGSTIVMKAINANSQKMVKKAISCAPRGERARWMLVVEVGTQNISPLVWSVESGNTEAAAAMIRDLLSFRADRDRYYYGVDELFQRHPDLIKILCDMAPDLLPKLLDGLIWRSRTTEAGLRRTNYYVKHLLISQEGTFSQALEWITGTKDPKLVCHPVVVLISNIVWRRVAYRSFLYGKSWLFFTLLVYIVGQSVLKHVNEADKRSDAERIAIFACRMFIYLLSMTQMVWSHLKDWIKSYREGNTIKVGCIRLPGYLTFWWDCASFFLTISLLAMCALEPIFWCFEHQGGKLFLDSCKEREGLLFPYYLFSMFAMFLYYVLLLDLTVVSTHVSAFVLVCLRMKEEVGLFLLALAACILTFSSAVGILKQELDDFAGIHRGSYALIRMVLQMYRADSYSDLRDEPTLLATVFVFLVFTVTFLSSLLVAQLSCAYHAVYEDMVGYARLERGQIICYIMPSVSKLRWNKFSTGLRLNKRIEFGEGDIGVAGGIQKREPANANPTTVDMIRRFGGSTSVEIQWPEDDQDGDGDDRFERMEKLIQRTLVRVTEKKGGKGASTSSGSGGGSKLESGSGSENDED